MASVSNDGLSNGSVKKRLLENGCHSSYLSIIPKYKIRKVSAVRDFPPGCGKVSPKIELNHEQNAVVSTNIEDMANAVLVDGVKESNFEIKSQSVEVVDCLVNLEEQQKLDRLVGEVVTTNMSAISNGVGEKISDDKSLGFELPKDLEKSEMELAKGTEDIQNDTSVKEVDEQSLHLVENVSGGHKTSVTEIGIVIDEPRPVSEVKMLSPPLQLISVMEHNSSSPKNKYRKRRVSALRDFPPFCGTNAPKLTEQNCFGVTEESKDVAGFDKEVIKNEVVETLTDVTEGADSLKERDVSIPKGRELKELPIVHSEEQEGVQCDNDGRSQVERTVVIMPEIMTKKESDAGVVGKETLVYLEDENEKTITVCSALGSGDEKSITEGAKPYCPGKQKSLDDPVIGNEIVVSQVKSDLTKTAANSSGSGHEIVKPIVQGLMAEPYSPWRHGEQTSLDCGNQVEKANQSRCKKAKATPSWHKKAKHVARKSNPSGKKKSASVAEATDGLSSALVVFDDEGPGLRASSNDGPCGWNREALHEDSPVRQGQREFDVALPPFGPNSSSHGDARTKVRETLRTFQAVCRKLLQSEESKSKPEEGKSKQGPNRIDLQAAKIIKEKGKEVNTGQHILGEVPGVEVGDEFQYRVELAIVGVHRLYQAGIDYMKQGGTLIAISIVSSGVYDDGLEDADVLIYSGQGGNVVGKVKTPEDQKLERGNLALKNSISVKNPVRVIRGSKETKTSESVDGKGKVVTTYVYDGLYTVENYWTEQGPKGKMVFMFKLVRIPGQPELAWKEVKSSKKNKVRHGVCVHDITEGKETFAISAVNTIDGEKPPPFNYIKKMIYPDWFKPSPFKGCDCVGRCSDSKKCSCAVKNGGEIPYNRNGAIVEVKPLVYECGPHCKCPPSCYNRVGQHGIKVPLEIFKTNSRGWGVRALTSIPSGTFICEYAGELLQDKEAERRIGNDEYLFDIGQNYSDCSVNSSAELNEVVEEGGYTIDAAQCGNIGRFINHSCSPNLYAQNVLYDHEDKKMPHIMLFAADNIPPLAELTYHYNYSVDQVHDSDGNIKVKKCYCGSSECSGRMY
ncbi:histone-lysine N-methyltransferase, H3 lysine-9 specific SUVH6-like [Lycium ferocissimum]|uniref:histone-lysine N-methyltransferase, H3 lysine-9 specific SUVH6-like n=1 Tax=Lycium ferocissimum TaxID=112874 RepID=UPI002814E5FA|nr:histone-lysine N-methyltransferase, H3 lysine-9 specific SUVH6-like [Lycium ferocissimum]XP_059299199.1 histone-lysine N-methyltransferase, H3 lysine-9 specific SUVH6-like [Lycium ferocissimum]XP_059299200.1 histone-lysine N-methyltransferase, H3 lysine-9 specific SUVH6-like [Lycium ferocissimum]XP_059299201.1 histone-lysine N-methyltransferase, H3 lysine-9 specific SUVH6-like [Lycium ferocissimum]XP_059299203.1 histone-lysine N-methyltransferase, H3 lysine-9 specific SUVH6-like [Lycium fero